jgi:hypothetical protein
MLVVVTPLLVRIMVDQLLKPLLPILFAFLLVMVYISLLLA